MLHTDVVAISGTRITLQYKEVYLTIQYCTLESNIHLDFKYDHTVTSVPAHNSDYSIKDILLKHSASQFFTSFLASVPHTVIVNICDKVLLLRYCTSLQYYSTQTAVNSCFNSFDLLCQERERKKCWKITEDRYTVLRISKKTCITLLN